MATANDVDLDFDTYGEEGSFTLQHYAFLVGEEDFDAIFARVLERGMDHWADPGRQQPGEIQIVDAEVGCFQNLVAGVGFEPTTFGL